MLFPASRRIALSPKWTRNILWRRARAVPSLDLPFADNKSLADAVTGQSLVTFTRASSGTYVDSTGTIKTAGTDVPRFDHNPTTGESLGLLVEEQRTNLLLQSNGFDTTWTNSNSSETGAAGTAPDGTNTAWELKDTLDSVTTSHTIQQNISFTSGTSYTFSIFVKPGTLSYIGLVFPGAAFGSTLISRFNLGAGVVGSAAAGSTCTIQAYPNGWYRCSMTLTATATATVAIGLRTAVPSASSYTGDGTGTILMWGAQLEAAAFPTSYTPTTTATTTRSADVASITGSAFSSWYRQDEGTVYAESRQLGDILGFVASVSDGTDNNRIAQFRNTTTLGSRFVRAGTTTNPSNLTITSSQALVRSAIGAAANTCASAANGTVTADITPTALPTVDRIGIGLGATGATQLNGTIRRLTYWPARLPNSTLAAITQ